MNALRPVPACISRPGALRFLLRVQERRVERTRRWIAAEERRATDEKLAADEREQRRPPPPAIKWRAMPVDFPVRDRVYAFIRRWRDKGLVKEFHDRLRGKTRAAAGRDPEPTAGIIDSQSVKAAASVPASSHGFDGGKKINGRKRPQVRGGADLVSGLPLTAGRGCGPQSETERLDTA